MKNHSSIKAAMYAAIITAVSLSLTACGGGSGKSEVVVPAPVADAPVTFEAPPVTTQASVEVLPMYHMAPVVLDEPTNGDADGNGTSTYMAPATKMLPRSVAGLNTSRLTGKRIEDTESHSSFSPMAASTSNVVVYTPAQVRAAYNLPAVSAPSIQPNATQLAAGGAGQTIYIINAFNNPYAFSDLTTFSRQFGLPLCTQDSIAPTAKLPLAAASPKATCSFSVVNATAQGTITPTVPGYDASWQSEASLDVQWAHAMAPYARIVLVQANAATLDSLTGAIKLANTMGPGVVSMSFGAKEGSWAPNVEQFFLSKGSSYVAATGDNGAGSYWPAVSANVLAVSGTSLTVSGTSRTEQVWANTGGGTLSAYVAQPAYQALIGIPGQSTTATKWRSPADVSMGADPMRGQYTLVTNSAGKAQWFSVGGTSLATPEWAAITTIANAQRAAMGKAPIGVTQNALYKFAQSPSTYGSVFRDITTGSDAPASGAPVNCAVTCVARAGYDNPTGLGTPNVTNLLGQLSAF